MKVLDTNSCFPWDAFDPEADPLPSANRSRFANLTELRCLPQVADWIIREFDMPNLQALTLTGNEDGTLDPSWTITSWPLLSCADTLVQLTTLGLEGTPVWYGLINFLRKFNQSPGKGISTLKLPGLPHPSILTPLVRALRKEPTGDIPKLAGREDDDYDPDIEFGCVSCFKSGWTCYEQVQNCERFSVSNMISISKDTAFGDYLGPDEGKLSE